MDVDEVDDGVMKSVSELIWYFGKVEIIELRVGVVRDKDAFKGMLDNLFSKAEILRKLRLEVMCTDEDGATPGVRERVGSSVWRRLGVVPTQHCKRLRYTAGH